MNYQWMITLNKNKRNKNKILLFIILFKKIKIEQILLGSRIIDEFPIWFWKLILMKKIYSTYFAYFHT